MTHLLIVALMIGCFFLGWQWRDIRAAREVDRIWQGIQPPAPRPDDSLLLSIDGQVFTKAPGESWQAQLWHAYPAEQEALAVLTRMACPAPCAGKVVEPEGWHLLCERKAWEALTVLRGPHQP